MQTFFRILIAGTLGGLVGCSEFIGPVERTSNTNTAIDVVGEPTDPTNDSTKTADILGAATTIPDGTGSIVDSIPDSLNFDRDLEGSETAADGLKDPDVVGNAETEKPDTLKTSGRNSEKKPF